VREGFAPQAVFRTAHKYVPVAAATINLPVESTLLKTPSGTNPSITVEALGKA
jgi:hypothetical protein